MNNISERILKYWNRISSGDIPNLLKDAANLLTHNVSSNSNNWVGKVMTIYKNLGLSSYFSAVWGCDPATRNQIMCVLRDQFLQKWHENLQRDQSVRGQGGNKLRSYRKFKFAFELEFYVDNILVPKYRAAMARLRTSGHTLAIETGRYHKPKPLAVPERQCSTYLVIEDECHLLCTCPKYSHIRRKMEKAVSKVFPQYTFMSVEQKFVFLLSHSHPQINNSVAAYIPFSHEIGLDRQQIYARRDNNMRACVIQPKSNHTPLHRNARALAISLPAFHPAMPPRLASIGQVRRS